MALPLVDKSPLEAEIGDTEGLVGADRVPGLNNPDAVDRPFLFDFGDLGANAYSAKPADAPPLSKRFQPRT